jgi:anti-sigma-K factor RskA
MNGHPTREEDFELLALGALEGDEKLALESHVASCAQCAQKLAEARGRIAMLALAAPPVAPSAAVKQRLMQQVRADAERTAPERTAARAPRETERAAGSFGRWWAAVLIPAGAVLAVATVLLWNENRQLDRQISTLREAAQLQHQQLQEKLDIADLIESHDTITVALAQQPGMPTGAAHVMYNSKMGMLMYEGEIAPAPAAKSYQLWLVPADGKPISAGVFNPVVGRPDHWMMKLPQGISAVEFAVSLEPAGGMPQPTGPMVLIGRA